ncbi:unnamed protein product [Adineta steineri]|uniref:Ubiquitin-like domain-containing protein n=1 Tax=Adineta steineri TaxID=433720 RepID=A0A813SQX5_9BILA|nr:unnamed protein product [Adineta steineri]CAF0814799.1 unnamed protein product [Adineta steineri]
MYQSRVFCLKLQLHFGGDIHEISVPAYDGAEPTVEDLMNVIEHDFRVPRALQNLVFHGQELHRQPDAVLSCFGIKNLGIIRLVGRMAPADQIQQINSQYNMNSCQQSNMIATFNTTEQNLPSYYYEQLRSIGTQYDPPPPPTPNKDQPPSTPDKTQLSQRSNDEEQTATSNIEQS